MKKLFILLLIINCQLSIINCIAQKALKTNKLQQDREAILSMAGCFKVSFDFAETFAPDTTYAYHKRYRESGIEYVFVIEESEKKIVLQHLLIVNDSTIIKHWRQDWVYENTELLGYYKDNEWRKTTLKAEEAKGQWTQKVFQVDDSPRYENSGTWLHVDGRHFWEASCDAPLPRREFTKRSDYNVMHRFSHIETAADGWYLEQDNDKIIRGNGTDKLLCSEKGMERFTKGNYNCQPAIDWWEKNKVFWADVRKVWDGVFEKNPVLGLEKKVGDAMLYEKLFRLGSFNTGKAGESKEDIVNAINMYLKKS